SAGIPGVQRSRKATGPPARLRAARSRLLAVRRRHERFRSGKWQVEGETTPNPRLGSLQGQHASVDFRQLMTDVETQTRAGDTLERRVLRAMKGLKYKGALRVRHPNAVVDDVDDGSISFGNRIQFEAWRPSRIGKAVVDQVVQDPADLACVTIHRHRFRPKSRRDLRPGQLDAWPRTVDRFLERLSKVQLSAI